jgi:hypothetical protein
VHREDEKYREHLIEKRERKRTFGRPVNRRIILK